MENERYGRIVALIWVNYQSLVEELVKNGLALIYTFFCSKPI